MVFLRPIKVECKRFIIAFRLDNRIIKCMRFSFQISVSCYNEFLYVFDYEYRIICI